MIKIDLQYFGGRGATSGSGKSSNSAAIGIKDRSAITVPKWFFDKVENESSNRGIWLARETDSNGNSIPNKLRIEKVLKETEKAYQVALDGETANGYPKEWKAWIPKSLVGKS